MTDKKHPEENLSDYGILNKDACDPFLRGRVAASLKSGEGKSASLSAEQLSEIATYIDQLEDALLRFHWGATEAHQINELLKCSTGLDIEARAAAISSMTASDA